MRKRTKKLLLSVTIGVVLLFGLLPCLLFVFSVPERVAKGVLGSQAREIGLSEFRMGKIDIRPSGRFVIEDLAIGGMIRDASHVLDGLDFRAGNITGRFRWLSVLGLSKHARPQAGGPLAAWVPGSFTELGVDEGDVEVRLTRGDQYVAEKIAFTFERKSPVAGSLKLSSDAIRRGEDPDRILIQKLALAARSSEARVVLENASGESPWGAVSLSGQTDNTYVLGREIARCLETVQGREDGEFFMSLSSALKEFQGTGLRLEGEYQAPDAISFTFRDNREVLSFTEGIQIALDETDRGLVVRGTLGAGSVSVGRSRLRWSQFPFDFAQGGFSVGSVSAMLEGSVPDKAPASRLRFMVTGALDEQDIPVTVKLETPDIISVESFLEAMISIWEEERLERMVSSLAGSASAELVVSGRLFPVRVDAASGKLAADLGIRVRPEFEPIPVSGLLELRCENDHIMVRSRDVRAANGEIALEVGMDLRDWEPVAIEGEFDVTDLRIDGESPLGQLLPMDVTGAVSARGSVKAGPDWRANIEGECVARAILTDVAYGKRSTGPVEATAEIQWSYGFFSFDPIRVSLLGGTVEGKVVWDGPRSPSSGAVDVEVELPSVRRLDSLVPEFSLSLDGSLRGHVVGEGTVAPDPLGQLRVTLATENPVWQGEYRADGLWLSAVLAPPQLDLEEIRLQSGESSVRAEGRVDAKRNLSGSFSAEIRDDVLKRYRSLGERETFSLLSDLRFGEDGMAMVTGSVSGTLDDPRADAEVSFDDIEFRNIVIEKLRAGVGYASSIINVDEFEAVASSRSAGEEVESATSILRGSGKVRVAGDRLVDIAVDCEPLDLRMVKDLASLPAELEGEMVGKARARYSDRIEDLDVSAYLAEMGISGIALRDVSIQGSLGEDMLDVVVSAKDLQSGVARFEGSVADDGACRLGVEVRDFEMPETLLPGRLAAGRITLHTTGETRLSGWPDVIDAVDMNSVIRNLTGAADLAAASASWRGIPLGDVVVEATGGGERFRALVSSASPSLNVVVTGPLEGGPVRITGRWEKVDLSGAMQRGEGAAADFVQSGTCDLVWSKDSGIGGEILSTEAQFQASGNTIVQREPCRIELGPEQVFIDGLVLGSEEIPEMLLVAKGRVPLATDRPDLDLELTLRDFDLAGLHLDREVFRDISGVCTLSGKITGSPAKPDFIGRASVSDGRFRLTEMEQSLSDISLEAVGTRDGLRIEHLDARVGRGTLSASGEIRKSPDAPPVLDVAVTIRNVRYRRREDLALDLEGNLRIYGPVDSSTIGGKVRVLRGSYTRPFDWTQIVLIGYGPRYVPRTKPLRWNPALDIAVSAAGNFWVRNSVLAAEFAGEGNIVGTRARPSLTGEVSALRGVFEANYGRFRIRKAVALFDESRPFSPYVVLQGETRLRGYVIRIRISGDRDAVEYEWGSSPPLSEGQIVRLLTTGTVERGDPASTNASAAWIASQGFRYSASQSASRTLAVESIDVRPVAKDDDDDEDAAEVLVETRVTERLAVRQYVDIKNPENPAMGADYKLTEHFSLAGRIGWDQNYIVELIYEIFF